MSAGNPTGLDFTDVIAMRQESGQAAIDRDETIAAIKIALRKRSGKTWSVKGGRGTGWGWITITAPPKRLVDYGRMIDEEADELGDLLSLGRSAHPQGEMIAASEDYRVEWVARAEGRLPSAIGEPYWD